MYCWQTYSAWRAPSIWLSQKISLMGEVSKSHLVFLDHTGEVPQPTSTLATSKHELSGEVRFVQWVACVVSAVMFVYCYHHCLQPSDGCWRDRQVYQAERKLFSSWICKPCLLCLRLQASTRAEAYPPLAAPPDGLPAGDSGTGTNSSWPPHSKAMRWNVPPPQPCISADYRPGELLCKAKPKELFLTFSWDGSSTRGCLICRPCSMWDEEHKHPDYFQWENSVRAVLLQMKGLS